MLCYDSVFGKAFIADEDDVKILIVALNYHLFEYGYLSLSQYQDMINEIKEQDEPYYDNVFIFPLWAIALRFVETAGNFNSVGWDKPKDNKEVFKLEYRELDSEPVAIIKSHIT